MFVYLTIRKGSTSQPENDPLPRFRDNEWNIFTVFFARTTQILISVLNANNCRYQYFDTDMQVIAPAQSSLKVPFQGKASLLLPITASQTVSRRAAAYLRQRPTKHRHCTSTCSSSAPQNLVHWGSYRDDKVAGPPSHAMLHAQHKQQLSTLERQELAVRLRRGERTCV
jgi:hypothetical protein